MGYSLGSQVAATAATDVEEACHDFLVRASAAGGDIDCFRRIDFATFLQSNADSNCLECDYCL